MLRTKKSVSKCSNTAKDTARGKNDPKEKVEIKDADVYAVNPRIHFNNDVHEEVQEFIKQISIDSQTEHDKDISNPKLLNVKKSKVRRLRNKSPSSDLLKSSRRASVAVIITTDYEPNNLSNMDYDRLKQVGHFLLS